MIDFGGLAERVNAISTAERRNWLEIPTSETPD
jgi:hypothetical protein